MTSKELIKDFENKLKIKNKGTGAGGSNTTLFGSEFEKNTSFKNILIDNGFIEIQMNKTKFGFYLKKSIDNIDYIFLTQGGLKIYFKNKYNIDLCRNPDEAYIIKTKDKCIVKILEKKEQQCEGSVETKLWAGPSLKREYQIILGDNFTVEYAYCLNDYLSEKINSDNIKYKVLNQILKENNIMILHASKSNYYKKLEEWIKKI
jgi:hypothetical protein